ncbi:hypothetical protein AB0D54_09480 [Streptomyces xanthophaeus]|uniref:hypothetical protein n=1 Tax=Streptomyces xanthophaeus TaxID=67385 RepID=UPI0034447856
MRAGQPPLGPDRTGRPHPGRPPLTARLATTVGRDIPGWPSARFAEIVDDLADHDQVILFSQFWRVEGEHAYWTRGPGLDWELDWTAPWSTLVEEARAWSLLEATESPSAEDTYVSITWLSPTDLDRPGTVGQ